MIIRVMEVKDGAVCMLEEEGGRACGTIAKVKNYERREKEDRVIMCNLFM